LFSSFIIIYAIIDTILLIFKLFHLHLLLLSNFGDIFVITESKSSFDIYFMEQALVEADLAEKNGDVPVGALIVKNGKH